MVPLSMKSALSNAWSIPSAAPNVFAAETLVSVSATSPPVSIEAPVVALMPVAA